MPGRISFLEFFSKTERYMILTYKSIEKRENSKINIRLRGITALKLDKNKVLPLILGNISSQIRSQIFMIHKENL